MFETIEQVAKGVELVAITPYQLNGFRRVEGDGTEEHGPALEAGFRVLEDSSAEVRLRMTLVTPQASLLADIAATYACEGRFGEEHQDLIGEFITRIGAMAVIPFLREAIMTTASRLGVEAPILGIVRQGELNFGDPVVGATFPG